MAKENPQVAKLKTIPGIGDVSALLLVAELGGVSRFAKARNVSAYIGLVPRLYSTSDTRRLGPITKQGSKMLRWILVQGAWLAIRQSKAFLNRYNKICKRRGKKIAIVATARLIAEVAYRVLRDNTVYNESLLAVR